MKLRSKKLLAALLTVSMLAPTLNHAANAVNAVNAAGTVQNGTYKADPVTTDVPSMSHERTQLFNSGWRFYQGTPTGAEAKDYDDSSWESISLPHDFSIDEAFSTSYEAESGFLPGGTGWYRKSFALGQDYDGKSVVLDFDGVYNVATVWVNGHQVGNHVYGYTPFAYDISDFLHYDGTDNVIAVKVEHEYPSSRWYSGSGIYRNVYLHVMDSVHVDYNGTKVTTPNLETQNGGDVTVELVTDVVNDGAEQAEVTVTSQIVDGAGNPVSDAVTSTETVAAGSSAAVSQSATVNNPALWSVDSPNLYKAVTTVTAGEKRDVCETPFGFRWYAFNRDTGFSLNGQNMKLKGVCMHHDQGALGAAAYRDAMERQIRILKEMGCNMIRVTHNPASREFIELCDQYGMLVIEEAFDSWKYPKNSNTCDYSRYFSATMTANPNLFGYENGITWAEYDIKSIVDRDKNAPCIILWSLGNEVLEGLDNGGDTSGYATVARNLADWVKEVDTAHPVTFGGNKVKENNSTENAIADAITEKGGVVGLNYASDAQFESLYSGHSSWIMMASETASAINSRGYYKDNSALELTAYDTSKVNWGRTANDSWQGVVTHDYIAGEAVWTGFDYIGEPTPWNGTGAGSRSGYGASPNSSYFGIIDTAGFPKDRFYYYQSQWNDEVNTVHIVPQSWNQEDLKVTNGNVTVDVYTDAASVDLQLNGTSLGTKSFTSTTTAAGHTYQLNNNKTYLTWEVPYAEGTLEAIAYDSSGTEIARDTVKTNSGASKIVAAADKNQLDADGSSLSYITLDVKDADDHLVNSASNQINVTLEGAGEIVGVDNGNAAETAKFQTPIAAGGKSAVIPAYHGKALVIVRSTETAGNIQVTASADGLTGASVSLSTAPSVEEENPGDSIASYTMVKSYMVKKGTQPSLETTAEVEMQDGTTEEGRITWDSVGADVCSVTGNHMIHGDLTCSAQTLRVGASLKVIENVVDLKNYSCTTKPGQIPTLPSDRPGLLIDGTESGSFPVTWALPEETAFANNGDVVEVAGTAEGTAEILGLSQDLDVTAYVRVDQGTVSGRTNVAVNAPHISESSTAPFASGTTTCGDTLASVINGVQTDNGTSNSRWSTWNVKSTAGGEAAITIGKDTAFAVDRIDMYYFYQHDANADSELPSSVRFEYSLDGNTFTEIGYGTPVELDTMTCSTVNGNRQWTKPIQYPLNEVINPTHIRITLGIPGNNKFIGVNEIEFMSPSYTYDKYATANLASLEAGGSAVTLEDGITEYTVEVADPAAASTTIVQSENAAATVLPKTADNRQYIVVESEDDSTTRVYLVKYKKTSDMSDYGMKQMYITAKGEAPELETNVTVTMKDGSTAAGTIVWDAIDANIYQTEGTYVITGTLTCNGESVPVGATLQVVDPPAGLKNYSTITTAGTVPTLPESRPGLFANGTKDADFAVTWAMPEASAFGTVGEVVEVTGTAEGTAEMFGLSQDLSVKAYVRVVEAPVTKNIALRATNEYDANPNGVEINTDHVYGSSGANENWPKFAIDGNKTAKGYTDWTRSITWDNVSLWLNWDKTYKMEYMNVYLGTGDSSNNVLPGAITVYDSDSADATGKAFTGTISGAASGSASQALRIDLDSVETNYLKTTFTHDTGKYIIVKEIEVFGYRDPETHSTANLASLTVDGNEVPLTDGTLEYTVEVADPKTAAAVVTQAENAAATVLPLTADNKQYIVVESEDDSTAQTYVITYERRTNIRDIVMEETYVTEKGTAPTLETNVTVNLKDNTTAQGTIAWDTIDENIYQTAGKHTITGTLTCGDESIPVSAVVWVIEPVVALKNYSTITTVDVAPTLPEKRPGLKIDGTEYGEYTVTWTMPEASAFHTVGEVVEVTGTAAGTAERFGLEQDLSVKAYVRVAETPVTKNIALRATNEYDANPNGVEINTDHVYESSGANENWPKFAIDGNKTAKGYTDWARNMTWDNVSLWLNWDKTYKMEYMNVYLGTGDSGTNVLPGRITAYTSQDADATGKAFGGTISGAANGSESQALRIDLDSVETNYLKTTFTHDTGKYIIVKEIEVFGYRDPETHNAANLGTLTVGGNEVSLTDGTLEYTVEVDDPAAAAAVVTQAENAAVTVLPKTADNKQYIVVESEDNSATQVYRIWYQKRTDIQDCVMKKTYVTGKGRIPTLETDVTVNLKDGTQAQGTITWDSVDESIYQTLGNHEITGTLTCGNASIPVSATVCVVEPVIDLKNYSTITGVNVVPVLPDSRPGLKIDGTEAGDFTITWPQLQASQFATAEETVEITGTAEGTAEAFGLEHDLDVTASVRVIAPYNIALREPDRYSENPNGVAAGGEHSSSTDGDNAPKLAIDGNKASGGFTDWASSMTWDQTSLWLTWDAACRMEYLNMYFCEEKSSIHRVLPTAINVYTSDAPDAAGKAFEGTITGAAEGTAGDPVRMDLDYVETNYLKMTFDHPTGNFIAVKEVEVFGYKTTDAHSSADLGGLTVNGTALTLKEDKTEYAVYVDDPKAAQVTVQKAENAAVTVLPVTDDNKQYIVVESEDDNTTTIYTIFYDKQEPRSVELKANPAELKVNETSTLTLTVFQPNDILDADCVGKGINIVEGAGTISENADGTYTFTAGIARGTVKLQAWASNNLAVQQDGRCTLSDIVILTVNDPNQELLDKLQELYDTTARYSAKTYTKDTHQALRTERTEAKEILDNPPQGDDAAAVIQRKIDSLTQARDNLIIRTVPNPTLTAVTGEGDSIVLTGRIEELCDPDNSFEVVEHGVIYIPKHRLGAKLLGVNTSGRYKVNFTGWYGDGEVADQTDPDKQGSFVYTLTTVAGSTFSAVAYCSYYNKDERLVYAYSDMKEVKIPVKETEENQTTTPTEGTEGGQTPTTTP